MFANMLTKITFFLVAMVTRQTFLKYSHVLVGYAKAIYAKVHTSAMCNIGSI